MINCNIQFNKVAVMKSAVQPYFWQKHGLALLYPYSSN